MVVPCRNGHQYAHRLMTALVQAYPEWDVNDGVMRLSLLHYNTPEEVEAAIQALEDILP